MKRISLLFVLLVATSSVQAQAASYEPVLESANCPFPVPAGEVMGQTLECDYLTVPENRADPDSNNVELAVAVLYSRSPDRALDPLVYLEGGPGGSALVGINDWVNSPYRDERDIILIDQRGTGYSKPTLDCDEFQDAEDPTQACYEALRQAGIDLNAYNSAANAADIADLRLALDLNEVNLYGISYGTRLALTIMRDYPEGIRSVVLDSTYPPQVNGLDEQPLYGARAIQHLFDQCEADLDCRATYGDLKQRFFDMVDQWNDTPYDGPDGQITGDDLVNQLFQALYISSAIPTLPYGIYLLSGGDYTTGLDILAGSYTLADLQALASGGTLPADVPVEVDESVYIPDGDSEGMFNSVECNEEIPFNSVEKTRSLSADLPPELYGAMVGGAEDEFNTCDLWDSGRASELETQPVHSDIPTLVLAGSFDPVTPPEWGQAAAENLSHSYYVEFPYGGHGLIDSGQCAVNIGLDFLDAPETAPDTGCVSDTPVQFYAPQACYLTALENIDLREGPGMDYAVSGQLEEGESASGTAYSDDGAFYWFQLGNESWVREDVVEYEGDCLMLPLIES